MKIGFKGFMVYRIKNHTELPWKELPERLAALPAGDPAIGQMQRSGFLPAIDGNDEMLTTLGKDQYAIALETALRIVPNKIVKRELAQREYRWEQTYNKAPTKAERAALKVAVITELMENALIDYSRMLAIVSGPYIYIDTTSAKKAELFLGALRRCFGSLPVIPLTVKDSSVLAFTDWATGKSKPAQLSIGESFQAKGTLEGGRVLTGKSVDLEGTTLSEMLGEGYNVIALQLNYFDEALHASTTFTLNENLVFRSVAWPDAIAETARDDAGAEDKDDAGIAFAKASLLLLAGALDEMVDGVAASLGGEVKPQLPDDELKDFVTALKGWKISHINGEELEKPVSLTGDEEDWLDPLYENVLDYILAEQKAGISMIQRQFRIGYNRAGRIIEDLEANGYIRQQANGAYIVLRTEPFKLGDTNMNTDFPGVGDDEEGLI